MRASLCAILLVLLPLTAEGAAAAAGAPVAERLAYHVLYRAWIKPGEQVATVRIRLSRHPEWVHWMRLKADPARYSGFKGSGDVEIKGGEVTWRPPASDAWLQYRVNLQSKRESGRFDGLVTPDWALFRADDLVPPVHLDMEDGTRSKAKLELNLPDGWSAATPFPRYTSGRYNLDNPHRLFDRPIGWLLLGKLGARHETVGGTRLTVAAPLGVGVRYTVAVGTSVGVGVGGTLNDAVTLMRGEVGTEVTVTIAREGRDPFDVTVARQTITTRAVTARLEGGERPVALALALVAVDRAHGEARALERLHQLLGAVLGAREDECQLVPVPVELLDQQFGLRRLVDEDQALPHLVGRLARRGGFQAEFHLRSGPARSELAELPRGRDASGSDCLHHRPERRRQVQFARCVPILARYLQTPGRRPAEGRAGS